MTVCSRCAELSGPSCTTDQAAGCVLVYAPAPPAMGKVRRVAAEAGYSTRLLDDGIVVLNGPAGDWSSLLNGLDARLSSLEAEETRVAPVGGLVANGYELATAALKARTLPMLIGELRDTWFQQAIEAQTFCSYFQPIVDVTSGAVFAHEALLRAPRQDGSIVNGGAIVEAGRRQGALHVLDQLGRTAAIHGARRLGMQTAVFINFFPTVVYDPVHCLASTRQAMRETGIQPDQIVFEVVESEHIADRGHLLDILSYYRAEGFRVALDDLGSGYSSLNLLVALRPDFVKLDMELAREVAVDPLRRALVQALVQTAHEYGIQTIAEGVETIESARVLSEMGVRLLQGYLFGRPAPALGSIPAEVLAALLATREPA